MELFPYQKRQIRNRLLGTKKEKNVHVRKKGKTYVEHYRNPQKLFIEPLQQCTENEEAFLV